VVSQINDEAGGSPVVIDDETEALIRAARELAVLTEGRFDPTVGVLRRVWDFHRAIVPAEAAIQALLPQPTNSSLTNNYLQTGLYLDYRYFGTGDQGGSPAAASVSNVCLSVQTTNGAVNVLNTGSDQIFRDLTPAQVAMLPTYKGELVMQTHGTGTYTAHAENKKYHRQCEQEAAEAECAALERGEAAVGRPWSGWEDLAQQSAKGRAA